MARLSIKQMRENVKKNAPGSFESEFWTPMDNLEQGASATLRFLPYEDEVSGGFWTIQKTLTATFTNPDNDEEEWKAYIPCLEMYTNDEKCPVTNEIRAVFKEADELVEEGMTEEGEAMKKAALGHWIRYNYMLQGFVIKGGNKPISPDAITAFRFPKSMFNIVYDSVMDEQDGFEELPCGEFDMDDLAALQAGEIPAGMDEEEFLRLFTGRGFIAKKTKKDKYNNYETSSWDLKEHDLDDEQANAVAENGMIDLRKFLPKQPTAEQYEVYVEMMKISLAAAMSGEDNTWNPEWEEVGIKPSKPKSDNNSSGGSKVSSSKSGGGLKSKLNKKLKKDDGDGDDDAPKQSASSVRAKLNKSRGAAKSDDAEESQADEASESDAEDTGAEESKAAPKSDRVAALSARLKAKKKAGAEA